MKNGFKMIELTEQKIHQLVKLAKEYAALKNLSEVDYINALLNSETVGEQDAGHMVTTLIKYHEDWLHKSAT